MENIRVNTENHYKFFTPLIIHTFGLLPLRITTKLQECTEITTFPTPPTNQTKTYMNSPLLNPRLKMSTNQGHRRKISTSKT